MNKSAGQVELKSSELNFVPSKIAPQAWNLFFHNKHIQINYFYILGGILGMKVYHLILELE